MTLTSRTRTFLLVAALAALAALPASAGAAVLTRSGATIYYTAGQGERNDVRMGRDVFLGQQVYTFTDDDAVPITVGGNLCEVASGGVGVCTSSGVTAAVINVRDQDDTVKISTGTSLGPVMTFNTIIGGRGIDVLTGGTGVDKLKGNNGRDTLRGRKGADIYKGGRGSDVLQALDGKADRRISCGDGRRDLLRADRKDPLPLNCELGNRKRRGKRR